MASLMIPAIRLTCGAASRRSGRPAWRSTSAPGSPKRRMKRHRRCAARLDLRIERGASSGLDASTSTASTSAALPRWRSCPSRPSWAIGEFSFRTPLGRRQCAGSTADPTSTENAAPACSRSAATASTAAAHRGDRRLRARASARPAARGGAPCRRNSGAGPSTGHAGGLDQLAHGASAASCSGPGSAAEHTTRIRWP